MEEADAAVVVQELNPDEEQRDNSFSLPVVTVFSVLVLRQLLIISVAVIVFDIIQLVCQVCLAIQSRHLITSIIASFSFCWTILLLFLTAKWILILSRNKIDIIRRGKSLAGCSQALSVLNLITAIVLLFLEDAREDHWKDYSVQWLVGTLVCCNCFNIVIFCVTISLIVRGQREVHRIIGSWLWMAIQRQLQRQQMLIEDNRELREYLSATYETMLEQQHSSAAA